MSCKIGDNSAICGRSCQTCIPLDERCKQKRCPSVPVVKEFHQGIIMSGDGLPPNTPLSADFPDRVKSTNPVPQCFYYQYFYDFKSNRFYTLEKDVNGDFAGYSELEDGERILNTLFRLTSAANIGAQGTVLASNTLLALQTCLNAQAVAGNSFAVAGSAKPLLNKFNCAINSSNMGSVGFVYLNQAPTPANLAVLEAGAGYTLTPDYVLTPPGILPDGTFDEFGYKGTVFIRDKRNGRYYRDSYNSPLNDPGFPPNAEKPLRPCNGDLHKYCTLTYEFDAKTCRWYLLDDSNPPSNVLGVFDGPFFPISELDCRCDCGVPEPPCPPSACHCCDSDEE